MTVRYLDDRYKGMPVACVRVFRARALTAEACLAGIIGSFPTSNAASADQLDELCIFGPREDDQPIPA